MRNLALHSGTTSPRATHPRSSDRVLQLLAAVGGSAVPLSLTEAATMVGLVPSTALRQLRSLEASGLLVRSDTDQLYRPGPALLSLSRTVFVGQSLPATAQPFLDQLASSTGESAYLAIGPNPGRASYVATAPGQHALRHNGWLGRTFPTASTAVGQALRGRVDDDGVVAREGRLEPGITAVSAPVRTRDGIVGAISVVGPTFRMVDRALDLVRRAVGDGVEQLSLSLGHPPIPHPRATPPR